MNDQLVNKTESQNVAGVKVIKIMHSPAINVLPNFSIQKTIETFKNHRISSAAVVNNEGELLGIVSEYDLLIQAATKDVEEKIQYTNNVITVDIHDTAKDALIKFLKYKLKQIPVINKDKIVKGVLSRIDVLALLATKNNP